MTYILIWIIVSSPSSANVAATGIAEFNSFKACASAAAAIEAQINPLKYVKAIAMCHDKGFKTN